jgi:hypothetical protein
LLLNSTVFKSPTNLPAEGKNSIAALKTVAHDLLNNFLTHFKEQQCFVNQI